MHDGRLLTLRPTPVESEPGKVRRLNDADAFRAAIERLDLANEEGATGEWVEALRRRVELASFYRCPACENEFGPRLNCELCTEKGLSMKVFSGAYSHNT